MQTVKLEEILTKNNNKIAIDDSKIYKQVTVRLWGRGVCKRNEIKGSKIKSGNRFVVSENQFIISKIDARHGAYGLVPKEIEGAIVTSDFPTYNLDLTKVLPQYFKWVFSQKEFIEKCRNASSGTTNRIRLKESKFLNLEIPLPSIIQQNQIVTKLNNQISTISMFKQYNSNIVDLIQKLRQTILQEAVSGKLVPQNPNDESASKLYKKIEAEKEKLIREGKIKKKKELPLISEEELSYDLPPGWIWVRLNSIMKFIDYRGKTPPKTLRGVRLITAKNVKEGHISYEPEEFISEETYKIHMTRGFPKQGDVLFTTEAPLGHVANLYTKEKVAFAQRIIILQDYCGINKEYIKFVLMSPYFQKKLEEKKTGLTAKGIKSAKLRLFLVPLPPLAEQERITKKITFLLGFCDRLEELADKNQTNADLLKERTLKDTFAL